MTRYGYDVDTDVLADAVENLAEDIRTGDAEVHDVFVGISARPDDAISYTFDIEFVSQRSFERYEGLQEYARKWEL